MNWPLLLSSFTLGLIHAVEPGHGKGIMVSIAFNKNLRYFSIFLFSFFTFLTHSIFTALLSLFLMYFSEAKTVYLIINNLRIPIFLSMLSIGLFYVYKGVRYKKSHACCGNNFDEIRKKLNHPKELLLLAVTLGLNPCPSSIFTFLNGLVGGSIWFAVLNVCIFSLGVAISIFILLIIVKTISHKLKFIEKQIVLSYYFFHIQGFLLILMAFLIYNHKY